MDSYRNGIGGNVGSFLGIGTPGDIKAQGESVNTDVESTSRDVEAKKSNGQIAADLYVNWIQFRDEWRKYWESKPSNWWASTSQTYINFRDKLVAWRELLRRNGIVTSSPDPVVPDKGFSLKWLLLGGGLLYVGYRVYQGRKKGEQTPWNR